MKRIKRDLPIYVLSAALVFLGISVSTETAGAAIDPRVSVLQKQIDSLRECANGNFGSLRDAVKTGRANRLNVPYCL
jgi:hypothetical protein